ncbi:MAG: four-carbon acid sugar kinase family protein [Deltaproteobacteria bacterium]|nr:four-carbon acid sugar kinase family protein [Deltaproteobacteria bacterium]
MKKQHCLLIADDLTGGADAGVQFAKRGLKTLLVPFRGEGDPLAARLVQDVLIINTITRGLPPAEAFDILSGLLKGFDPHRFPILYKKIDSTLRGNIGVEIDAILRETKLPVCFLAPSYPEQGRVLVGGIMMVGEKPLALTEASRDAASPVQESHICKLLANQTSLSIGTIDLTHVASGKDALRRLVEKEQRAGLRIIIFDAVSRQDLATIAEVALSMETVPLLAGSAGLAGEVARILVPGQVPIVRERQRTFQHILIIGGSASAVTHAQLQRLQDGGLPSFELPRDLVSGNGGTEIKDRRKLARLLGRTLVGGIVIFRTFPERWTGNGDGGTPIPQRIAGVMAGVTLETLQEARINAGDLAMILTGGDTALGVLRLLDYEGIELEGELLEGIVRGNLRGGPWEGLTLVTKAGAFGKEDALVRIVEKLETAAGFTEKGCLLHDKLWKARQPKRVREGGQ